MWDVHDIAAPERLPGVLGFHYDACIHGGRRKKAQKLLCNAVELDELRGRCQGGHTHLPWVPMWDRHKSVGFASHLEAEYPSRFCEAYVECLLKRYPINTTARVADPPPGSAPDLRRKLQEVRKGRTAHLKASAGVQPRSFGPRLLPRVCQVHRGVRGR